MARSGLSLSSARTAGGTASSQPQFGPKWAREQSGSFSPGRAAAPPGSHVHSAAGASSSAADATGLGLGGPPVGPGGFEFGSTTDELFNPSRGSHSQRLSMALGDSDAGLGYGGTPATSSGERHSSSALSGTPGSGASGAPGADNAPASRDAGNTARQWDSLNWQERSRERDALRDRDRDRSERPRDRWGDRSERDRTTRERGGWAERDRDRQRDGRKPWDQAHSSAGGDAASGRREREFDGRDRDRDRRDGGERLRDRAARGTTGPTGPRPSGPSYTVADMLTMHKPTSLPPRMEVIERITTRDSLSPCLLSPMDSDEIARIWSAARGKGRGRGREWDERADDRRGRRTGARREEDDGDGGGRGRGFSGWDDGGGGGRSSAARKDMETFGDDVALGEGGGEAGEDWETFALQASEFEEMKAAHHKTQAQQTQARNAVAGGREVSAPAGADFFGLGSATTAPQGRDDEAAWSAPPPAATTDVPSSHGPAPGATQRHAQVPAVTPQEQLVWFYKDPHGRVQGEFTSEQMREWLQHGYFSDDLPIRCGTQTDYVPLGAAFPEAATAFLSAPTLPSASAPHASSDAAPADAAAREHEAAAAFAASSADAQSALVGELDKHRRLQAQVQHALYTEHQAASAMAQRGQPVPHDAAVRMQDMQRYLTQLTAHVASLEQQLHSTRSAAAHASAPAAKSAWGAAPGASGQLSSTLGSSSPASGPGIVRAPVAEEHPEEDAPTPTDAPRAAQRAGDSGSNATSRASRADADAATAAALSEMGSQLKHMLGVGTAPAAPNTATRPTPASTSSAEAQRPSGGGTTAPQAPQARSSATGARRDKAAARASGRGASTTAAASGTSSSGAATAQTTAAKPAPPPSQSAWGAKAPATKATRSLKEIQADEARERERAEREARARGVDPHAAKGVWGATPSSSTRVTSLRDIQAAEEKAASAHANDSGRARHTSAAAVVAASAPAPGATGVWGSGSLPGARGAHAPRGPAGAQPAAARGPVPTPASTGSDDMVWGGDAGSSTRRPLPKSTGPRGPAGNNPAGPGAGARSTRVGGGAAMHAGPKAVSAPRAAPEPRGSAGSGAPRGAAAADAGAFGGDMPDELMRWCATEMLKVTGSDDVTLMQFCMTLESAADIREYMRTYMGSTPQVSAFASEFIKRRKDSRSSSAAPKAGTVASSAGSGPATSSGGRKKGRKRR